MGHPKERAPGPGKGLLLLCREGPGAGRGKDSGRWRQVLLRDGCEEVQGRAMGAAGLGGGVPLNLT